MAAKKGRRNKRPKPPTATRTGLRGRPTVFTQVIHEKILSLIKDGLTDFEVAERIGVTERTLNYWKRQHHDFFQAIKETKNLADQMVEASLFQRACGYSHQAVKHFMDKQVQIDQDGNRVMKTVILEKEYVEHYPPSEVAAIFWLKNRQPERWRDKPINSDDDNQGGPKEPKEIIVEFQDETPNKDAK